MTDCKDASSNHDADTLCQVMSLFTEYYEHSLQPFDYLLTAIFERERYIDSVSELAPD